jgi:hypothetical protein
MKNALLKIGVLPLFLLALALFGCKKDPTLAEQITGTWNVKSLMVDGVESIGANITSMEMDYQALSGSVGDFDWTIVYTQGPFSRLTGQWSVDETEDNLNIIEMDGGMVVFSYSFDIALLDNDLELKGIFDGKDTHIKAQRK